MENPRVRVYLDDEPQPTVDRELPTEISLDTTNLADGPHRLTIRVQDEWGYWPYKSPSTADGSGPIGVLVVAYSL
jgi:hypothetical protein